MELHNAHVEELRDILFSTISDTFKEINGVRPRFYNVKEMSIAELDAEVESLCREADAHFEQEQKLQEEDTVMFEARIAIMMKDHGISRNTAIRWEMEAYELSPTKLWDIEEYCYHLNLAYHKANDFFAELNGYCKVYL